MKILITGAMGMLGSNLSFMYSKENEVFATGIKLPSIPNCQILDLDITNKEDLKLIKKIKPDLVIHCAAITNVDFCEKNPEIAEKINAVGTKNVAEAVKEAKSFLIHISTDAVFDGEKGDYVEEDILNPINIYGKTKMIAENFVQEINGDYSIIRTNIYGWNKQNKMSIAEWMLNKLEKKEKIPAFRDIIFSPLLVNNLGEAILDLYRVKYRGILHVAGIESCSKLEFAYKIAKVFNLDSSLIESTTIEDMKLKAKRAKNMSLNVAKAKNKLNIKLLNIEKGLEKFKELKNSGFTKKLKEK